MTQTSQDFQTPNQQINYVDTFSTPSVTSTAANKQNQMAQHMASLDDEAARNWANMSNAQQQAQLNSMIPGSSGAGLMGHDEIDINTTIDMGVGDDAFW
jgi:hypothetical protein